MIIGICSGYFNPLNGLGHIGYLYHASELCDKLIVVINNDKQVKLKESIPFMDEITRGLIIEAIRYVDEVFISKSDTSDVACDLELIKNNYIEDEVIFFNGGDVNKPNPKEYEMCKRLNIKMQYGIGGSYKSSSSSTLITHAAQAWIRKNNVFPR